MFPSRVTLHESFEVTGKWWLPEKPESQIHGTLRFASDSLTLILSGNFTDRPIDGIVRYDFERYAVVHGESDEGRRFTLLDVRVNETAARTVYSAIYLLVGCHSPAQLSIKSISFACSRLDVFVNRIGFAVEHDDPGIGFRNLKATFSKPDKIDFRIDAIQANLQLDSGLNVGRAGGGTKLTLTGYSFFDLTPDVPQSLDYFMQNVWRLCYLLTLLMDESVSPEWFRVETDDTATEQWLVYRTCKPRSDTDSAVSPLPLLYYGHCHSEFSCILDKWFSASDIFVSAIHLFINARRGGSPIIEPRFLTAIQGVEVFSRALSPSRETLANRMRALFAMLQPATCGCICVVQDNFIKGTVATRNYFTHYADDLRANALRGVELAWMTEKLLMLLRILLLKHIGIEESLIVERVKSHPMLMQHIFIWEQFRESVAD